MCPAKSTIVPFKKQMYSSGSIILSYKDDKCICVSIHAPTRGCDLYHHVRTGWQRVSIHAPTRGATNYCEPFDKIWQFQSTHPRGVRQATRARELDMASFNPRTHEGCDLPNLCSDEDFYVSIHAPTRGATANVANSFEMEVFQSTHPRGVRLKRFTSCWR